MTEIVTTSITADGGDDNRYNDVQGRLEENPCIQFFDNRYRGYTLVHFFRNEIRADFRVVDRIDKPDGVFSTLASMIVADGSVGAVRQDVSGF